MPCFFMTQNEVPACLAFFWKFISDDRLKELAKWRDKYLDLENQHKDMKGKYSILIESYSKLQEAHAALEAKHAELKKQLPDVFIPENPFHTPSVRFD